MKISNISSKTIDFFKNNGRRYICLASTCSMMLFPAISLGEDNTMGTMEYSEIISIANKTIESISFELNDYEVDENTIFTIEGAWEKVSDGYYHRKIYQVKPKQEAITKEFLNNFNNKSPYMNNMIYAINDVFGIVDEKDEEMIIDKKGEQGINTTNWTIKVDGENVKMIVKIKQEDKEQEKDQMLLSISLFALIIAVYSLTFTMANSSVYRRKRY